MKALFHDEEEEKSVGLNFIIPSQNWCSGFFFCCLEFQFQMIFFVVGSGLNFSIGPYTNVKYNEFYLYRWMDGLKNKRHA